MLIRVYNYNTMDKVKVFEAHTDYIRCGSGCARVELVGTGVGSWEGGCQQMYH